MDLLEKETAKSVVAFHTVFQALDLTPIDWMTIRDLLELGDAENDRPLIVVLALMFAAMREGSLCLELNDNHVGRLVPGTEIERVNDLINRFLVRLKKKQYRHLVATGKSNRYPLVFETSGGMKRLYFQKYYFHEKHLHRQIETFLSVDHPCGSTGPSIDTILNEIFSEERSIRLGKTGRPISRDPDQIAAIRQALSSSFTIISGGPGTGKTTIVRAFVRIFASKSLEVALAAPTGRAAKRMSELAGRPAKTIHRMLEFNPQDGFFRRNAGTPLEADVVIVDETSMLDILLASALLKAVKAGTSIIFVGDVDQLPPVGPGSFLRDVITSGAVPVARLTRIFRQDEGGDIVENAHRINAGEYPEFSKGEGDFYLIEKESPGQVAGEIVDLCSRRLPERFGLDKVSDIQVLSPMYKGDAGATNLNLMLQQAINPHGKKIEEIRFKIGDKVMQLRNNYDKMVFNGDIGQVVDSDSEEDTLTIRFDFEVEYDRAELDEITLAYAITVHKSQGSEFPCIVMPVLTQHYIMLYRNLIYTAVTRAKKLVVLVGTRKAMALAVRNIRSDQRFSSLADRLTDIMNQTSDQS